MDKNIKQAHNNKNFLKIVFFGPESTGKTTLARDLADYFNSSWAAEFMREYLQDKWDQYKEVCQLEDLIPIALGQTQNELKAEKNAGKVVFYDTNLLQLKVYAEVYYNGFCPPEIEKEALSRYYDLYFLLYVDTPWEADDLRDKPNEREEMFKRFESELLKQNLSFITLKGTYSQRLEKAKAVVENLLHKSQ